MFSKEPSNSPRCATVTYQDNELYWERHWETDQTSAQWLIALTADHHNFPQQDLGTIKAADPSEVGHKHEEPHRQTRKLINDWTILHCTVNIIIFTILRGKASPKAAPQEK